MFKKSFLTYYLKSIYYFYALFKILVCVLDLCYRQLRLTERFNLFQMMLRQSSKNSLDYLTKYALFTVFRFIFNLANYLKEQYVNCTFLR